MAMSSSTVTINPTLLQHAKKLHTDLVNFINSNLSSIGLTSIDKAAIQEIRAEICTTVSFGTPVVIKPQTDVDYLTRYAPRLSLILDISNRDNMKEEKTESTGILSSKTLRVKGRVARDLETIANTHQSAPTIADIIACYLSAQAKAVQLERNLATLETEKDEEIKRLHEAHQLQVQYLQDEIARLKGEVVAKAQDVAEIKAEKAKVQDQLLGTIQQMPAALDRVQRVVARFALKVNGETGKSDLLEIEDTQHSNKSPLQIMAPDSAVAASNRGLFAAPKGNILKSDLETNVDKLWQTMSPQRVAIFKLLRERSQDQKNVVMLLQKDLLMEIFTGKYTKTATVIAPYAAALKLLIDTSLSDEMPSVGENSRITRVVRLLESARDNQGTLIEKDIPLLFDEEMHTLFNERYLQLTETTKDYNYKK